ncbi:MAG TPA: hypothetical protein DHW42_10075 [Candidatus Marinimicrobia bacterium]|nr:hypothetical protein [Candidatus Neomarinimicrobiota bacterium]
MTKKWVDSAPQGLRVIIYVGYVDQVESQSLAAPATRFNLEETDKRWQEQPYNTSDENNND